MTVPWTVQCWMACQQSDLFLNACNNKNNVKAWMKDIEGYWGDFVTSQFCHNLLSEVSRTLKLLRDACVESPGAENVGRFSALQWLSPWNQSGWMASGLGAETTGVKRTPWSLLLPIITRSWQKSDMKLASIRQTLKSYRRAPRICLNVGWMTGGVTGVV